MKGVNWLGVLLALVAGQAFGMLWYGVLFMEEWQDLTGIIAQEDAKAQAYALGAVLNLVSVIGLAIAIKKLGMETLAGGAKIGLFAAVFFVLPALAMDAVYGVDALELLLIDCVYPLVYCGVGGALIGGVKLKAKAA